MNSIRRIVTGHDKNGKAIFIADNSFEPILISTGDTAMDSQAVFFWQEYNSQLEMSKIAYTIVTKDGITKKLLLETNDNAENASAKIVNGQLLIVFEAANNKIEIHSKNL
jgi:hypothetical protein